MALARPARPASVPPPCGGVGRSPEAHPDKDGPRCPWRTRSRSVEGRPEKTPRGGAEQSLGLPVERVQRRPEASAKGGGKASSWRYCNVLSGHGTIACGSQGAWGIAILDCFHDHELAVTITHDTPRAQPWGDHCVSVGFVPAATRIRDMAASDDPWYWGTFFMFPGERHMQVWSGCGGARSSHQKVMNMPGFLETGQALLLRRLNGEISAFLGPTTHIASLTSDKPIVPCLILGRSTRLRACVTRIETALLGRSAKVAALRQAEAQEEKDRGDTSSTSSGAGADKAGRAREEKDREVSSSTSSAAFADRAANPRGGKGRVDVSSISPRGGAGKAGEAHAAPGADASSIPPGRRGGEMLGGRRRGPPGMGAAKGPERHTSAGQPRCRPRPRREGGEAWASAVAKQYRCCHGGGACTNRSGCPGRIRQESPVKQPPVQPRPRAAPPAGDPRRQPRFASAVGACPTRSYYSMAVCRRRQFGPHAEALGDGAPGSHL